MNVMTDARRLTRWKMKKIVNPLKKKIGIIGGGQLGKMMILDAKRLGFYVVTLDPNPLCPSASISDAHILAEFDDRSAIERLANQVDVITYEFEHIDAACLQALVKKGHEVYPTPESLRIIQDKSEQKAVLRAAGLPVPEFVTVDTVDQIKAYGESVGYPMMLKACTGGYDGKGNSLIRHAADVEASYNELGGASIKLMAETFVPFIKEISVLACRGIDGNVCVYPVAENIHVNSILDTTIVPARITASCQEKAMSLAESVMDVFHGVGMFCVEMFVTEAGEVLINEVAPRPHNSGHYTIEGCYTSQFENHIRAIVALPLGSVALHGPTVMRNLLGAPNEEGLPYVEGIVAASQIPGLKIHIYGKSVTKPLRKMGHVTAIDQTIEAALAKANKGFETLSIVADHEPLEIV